MERAALHVLYLLSPFCERIEVTGALRRKERAKEAEVIALPKETAVFGFSNGVEKAVKALGLKVTQRSKLFLRVSTEAGECVVWVAPEKAAWYPLLIQTTGCEDFFVYFTYFARKRGFEIQDGFLKKGGRVVTPHSEYHMFELCGVPWLSPQERGEDFREKLFSRL
jgi:hypothetical protein